jgi:hypothetical protein
MLTKADPPGMSMPLLKSSREMTNRSIDAILIGMSERD